MVFPPLKHFVAKRYTEGGFSDQNEGVVEDGELHKHPKPKDKRALGIELCKRYQKACEQKLGQGDYIQRKATLVMKAVKELGEPRLRELLNYYLHSPDEKVRKKFENSPQISAAISANTQEMFRQYEIKMK